MPTNLKRNRVSSMHRLGGVINMRGAVIQPELKSFLSSAEEPTGGSWKKFVQHSTTGSRVVQGGAGVAKSIHKVHEAIQNIKKQITPLPETGKSDSRKFVPRPTEPPRPQPRPIEPPQPQGLVSTASGSGFVPTGGGFSPTGGGFEPTGSMTRDTRRGPYRKIRPDNIKRGVVRVLNLLRDTLPAPAMEVELKRPDSDLVGDATGNYTTDPTGSGTDESYTSLLNTQIPGFKKQIDGFADIIAREIVLDLTENLEENESFRKSLAKIIMTFVKMAEENPDLVDSELQAARTKNKLRNISGGKFTMDGVSKFFKKAGHTISNAAGQVEDFLGKHGETIRTIAAVAPLFL